MEEFITAHTGKIISFIVAGFLGVVGWLIRDAKKETKQDGRLDALEERLDEKEGTLTACMNVVKADVAKLKTDSAVNKAVVERIEANVEKILDKLEGK